MDLRTFKGGGGCDPWNLTTFDPLVGGCKLKSDGGITEDRDRERRREEARRREEERGGKEERWRTR